MSCLGGLDLVLAILYYLIFGTVMKLYLLEILALWEEEGRKRQALHLSSKLKHITRRIKERKRKGKSQ